MTDKNIVYVVLKNSDFTDGRGHMMLHMVFSTFELAEKYIMSKDGIYGSKQDRNLSVFDDKYHANYNGYAIKTVEVLNSLKSPKQKLQESGLAKLTEDEISALGIDLNAFYSWQ